MDEVERAEATAPHCFRARLMDGDIAKSQEAARFPKAEKDLQGLFVLSCLVCLPCLIHAHFCLSFPCVRGLKLPLVSFFFRPWIGIRAAEHGARPSCGALESSLLISPNDRRRYHCLWLRVSYIRQAAAVHFLSASYTTPLLVPSCWGDLVAVLVWLQDNTTAG